MKLFQIIRKVEEFYPKHLAMDWDKIGLQLGDENKEVTSILTALEITNEVIEEAKEKKVDLIIAHHPLIFNPISELSYKDAQNKKIIELINSDIAVYVAHTNIDVAYGGLNDWLCEVLNIQKVRLFEKTSAVSLYSLEVEVDVNNVETILEVLPKLGLGINRKGNENYLMSPRIKRFKNKTSNNSIEKDTVIIETVSTKDQILLFKQYSKALKKQKNISLNIKIFKLEDQEISYGLGRVGYVKPQTLECLSTVISKTFNQRDIKIVGSREKIIKKVAILGGSGGDYNLIKKAKEMGCDAYITGDVNFHQAQYAKDLGISIIDASHYIEIIFNDGMCKFLKLLDGIKVFSSEVDSNPFEVL